MNCTSNQTLHRYSLLKKGVAVLLLIGAFFFLFTHFIHPINFVTADLGRHIRNGQLLLQGHTSVLNENFYSANYSTNPFVNHHWGAGVIFYGLHQWVGFVGLSWFYLIVLLLTVLLFFDALRRQIHWSAAIFLFVLSAPVMADRIEIRPEGFSVMFAAIYWWILWGFKDQKLTSRWLYLLPLLQVLWANIHIFFMAGWFMVLFFMIDAIVNKHPHRTTLFSVGVLTIVASVLNPSGWIGALQPLNIFNGFGYRLAENQSVFFMMDRFGDANYGHFIVMSVAALVVAGFHCIVRREWQKHTALLLILIAMVGVGVGVSRCMAMASFFILSIGGYFLVKVMSDFLPQWIVYMSFMAGAVLILVAGFSGFFPYWSGHQRLVNMFPQVFAEDNSLNHVLRQHRLWTGVLPVMHRSASFFKKQGLEGPIFNNYDIGGYLIYHLFPRERLFVDNRQEAFPASFFREEFIPMQENEALWKQKEKEYRFNAIFFYRHDLTPWGQSFLINRVQDPTWAPVFVDGFAIIFLKRNAKNARIIKNFELPPHIFGVKKVQHN